MSRHPPHDYSRAGDAIGRTKQQPHDEINDKIALETRSEKFIRLLGEAHPERRPCSRESGTTS